MRLTIDLDAAAAAFYTRVAESARLPLETVVADALFKLAGAFPRSAPQALTAVPFPDITIRERGIFSTF